jgi:hypothetical protein
MIYRVKSSGTSLDFGSLQAANQLIDNYPPHVQEVVGIGEITLEELDKTVANLSADLSKCRNESSSYYQWLLSRIEFYQDSRAAVESKEASIKAKVAALPIWAPEDGKPPTNEVWS